MCIYIMLILESDSAADECKQHARRCCYSRSNPGSGPTSGAQ